MNKKATNPHDRFIRCSMAIRQVAEQFCRTYLPDDIIAEFDFTSLKLGNQSFVDPKLRERVTDLNFTVKCQGLGTMVHCHIEHQSSPEYWMMLRLHEYRLRIWEYYRKQHSGTKHIPHVIPIIVCNSDSGCNDDNMPTSINSLFKFPIELSKQHLHDDVILVDYYQITEKNLRELTWAGPMGLVMRRNEPVDALTWIKRNKDSLVKLAKEPRGIEYIYEILHYNRQVRMVFDEHELEDYIFNLLFSLGDKDMMTYYESKEDRLWREGHQEGHQEGRQAGHQAGRQETERLIVKNMLHAGMSRIQISETTGISLQLIDNLETAAH